MEIESEAELITRALELAADHDPKLNYTAKEVDQFPDWLRCCYFIRSFNKRMKVPATIAEWAARIGFVRFHIDGRFYRGALNEAIKAARWLIAFVEKEFDIRFKEEIDRENMEWGVERGEF